jgi:glyoxylase-like metal-dependent hydrolase (beta-lactamase superfamily II)
MTMRHILPLAILCAAGTAVPGLAQANLENVQIHTEHVQGNVYLLVGAGGNTTVQAGEDGVLIVDTQFAPLAPKLMAAIRELSQGPVQWIINTHAHPDHVGGNDALQKLVPLDNSAPLNIIAHENVLTRLTAPGAPPFPQDGLPLDTYVTPTKRLHFNGEAVIVFHPPNAHTDGDSIVFFRGSDVISTGDIFTPGGYPGIDVERGGSVQGEIAALNSILELTVPVHTQEGGTYIVPGHGRICDVADLVEYRDMVVIIRDRVQDMIERGMTLEQIKAERPSRDYDTEYVRPDSFMKADTFVEAIFKSLTNPPEGAE